jgi:hypothetical protein
MERLARASQPISQDAGGRLGTFADHDLQLAAQRVRQAVQAVRKDFVHRRRRGIFVAEQFRGGEEMIGAGPAGGRAAERIVDRSTTKPTSTAPPIPKVRQFSLNHASD